MHASAGLGSQEHGGVAHRSVTMGGYWLFRRDGQESEERELFFM